MQRSLSLTLLASANSLESAADRNTVLGSSSLNALSPLSGWSGCRGADPSITSAPSMSYLTGSSTKKYLSDTGSMTSLFIP